MENFHVSSQLQLKHDKNRLDPQGCGGKSSTEGETRSVLHCNRFQMVLETKADSEHQKKSVNLGERTRLEMSEHRRRFVAHRKVLQVKLSPSFISITEPLFAG